MHTDGTWKSFYTSTQLTCAICSFLQYPTLYLRGSCAEGSIDYVYYPINNAMGDIQYEGYQEMNIYLKDNNWTFVHHLNPNNFALPNLTVLQNEYPIGRKEWHFEPGARTECLETGSRNFSFSTCVMEKEFTCENGLCISLDKRCDNIPFDCGDNSDEKECAFFKLKDEYAKESPPKNIINGKLYPLEVGVYFYIKSVEHIDLNHNKIQIVYNLEFSWIEPRLSYFNVEQTKQSLPNSAFDELWTPFRVLHHKNAVFGTVEEDLNFETIKVQIQGPPDDLSMESIFEDKRYAGEKGILIHRRRLNALYDCHYDLFRFPFDQQNCSIKLNLKNNLKYTLRIRQPNISAIFEGLRVLNEFEITGWYHFTNYSFPDMHFGFGITFAHLYQKQIINLYFQQFFLWIVSYLTIYIDINDFSNRFMGTVTALLVLSTLIDNMNTRLSARAIVRLIDIWNIWYILQIILIIVFHILLNSQLHQYSLKKDFGLRKAITPQLLNRFAKYLFPLLNIAFMLYYFMHNFIYQEKIAKHIN